MCCNKGRALSWEDYSGLGCLFQVAVLHGHVPDQVFKAPLVW